MHSTTQSTASKKMIWTGRIVSALVIVLMLFDATIKVLRLPAAVAGAVQVGYPANVVLPIGIVLLVCVVLYAIPRTSILGAILLTGYLGGAVATNVRISSPLLSYGLLPAYIGVLAWGGLFLRDESLRQLIPLRSSDRG
ncbi:MAG: DoxX family protein [Candidatus Korobacteraceae bacterium]